MLINGPVAIMLDQQGRIAQLEQAIRKHRDAKSNDRCWENDLELYQVLGEELPLSPELPPKEEFLKNCNCYYDGQAQRKSNDR